MELSAFARQILMSPHLEDKLHTPASFKDSAPRAEGGALPRLPERPGALRFDSGKKSAFPRLHELRDQTARARVFHFFANHELLALELMALALLKFPDAPKTFRLGIAQTIVEEQRHFRLYQKRMGELGLAFGDVGVNDFFWKSLSPMRTPLDYVCGMNLVFEQANLDFSRFYRDVFAKMGDEVSAAIMQTVYEEEIGHVRLGVTWLDRWKDEGECQWDAFQKHLIFPVTPARAKAEPMDRGARALAGFSEAYMDELEVYPLAVSRRVDVHWYNPDCEREWAGGRGYEPDQETRARMTDFATLPLFLADEGDIVLCPRAPTPAFLKEWQKLGIARVFFEETPDPARPKTQWSAPITPARFRPWGMTPRAKEWSDKTGLVLPAYAKEKGKNWFSKAILPDLRRAHRGAHLESLPLLGSETACGVLCRTWEDVLAARGAIAREEGEDALVVKAPFSAAGQARVRFRSGEEPSASQKGWIEKTLAREGAVIAEPWLHGVIDFSFLFQAENGRLKELGATRFMSDHRGQYVGHVVSDPMDGLTTEQKRILKQRTPKGASLWSVMEEGARFAATWLLQDGFEGFFGVDSFIYERDGRWIARPIGEVNARATMGHVALNLRRVVAPDEPAVWRAFSRAVLARSGDPSLQKFWNRLEERHPVQTMEHGGGVRFKKGVMATNDPSLAKEALGVLAVGVDAVAEFDSGKERDEALYATRDS